MKKTFCDVKGCKEEAIKEQIDVCVGWLMSTWTTVYGKDKSIKLKPFEKPTLRKMDLCEKHYKAWCKTTYNVIVKAKDRIK